MAEQQSLAQRIKAELDARAQRLQADETQRAAKQQEREARLERFNKVCDELKTSWRPRLDEFAKQFGEQIKVTPRVDREQRQATMVFLTDLANVTLGLLVSTDSEVTKLVLDYDLRIIPMFFDYERTARLEMPLDKIDRDAVGRWIDDRLISCVKAYLSIQDNQYYLQRAMVEDPITKARFLREHAVAKLEHNGQTWYFKSNDSLREYKQKHQIDQPPAPPAPAAPATTGQTTPTAAATPTKPAAGPTKPVAPGKKPS